MNVFKGIGGFFKQAGKLLTKAWSAANDAGLDDAVIAWALPLVRAASQKFVDNEQKRQWVIAALVARFKIPTRIAALAVELAYNLYRNEIGERLGP